MAGNVFFIALDAHIKWKIRLQKYLAGTSEELLDPNIICKDDQCTLGKWIYGAGRQFSKLDAYENLRTTHAQFHRCAAEVVRKKDLGDKTAAETIFKNDYANLSSKIRNTLVKMNTTLKAMNIGVADK